MRIHMRVTASLLMEQLGTGLYTSVGQRVMELVRNSARACMPDPKKWEPKKVKIEVFLTPNHPLAHGEAALTVLDYGRGFTEPDLDRYFNWLGTPLSKWAADAEDSVGDSQKGIGRMAALALNQGCFQPNKRLREKHGYYLLTRTSAAGKVRFVEVIPGKLETEGVETDRWVEPTSTEMGPLKGIKGSFSAIIVPTPIFKDHKEIYEAVKWFLPRERDKMFDLKIGGKAVEPPPLESEINKTSQDGKYRARIGMGNIESGGIWLCDETTGFRVASCQKLGRLLPEPLSDPDLCGDIFWPGLLRHQDTARAQLAHEYTRKGNPAWQKGVLFLIRDVIPDAKNLVNRETICGDAAETLDDLVEMFTDLYGEPVNGTGERKPRAPKSDASEPASNGGGGSGEPPYRRQVSIRVREEVFVLYRGRSLDPYRFAEVNPDNRKMIFVNVRGNYRALPSGKHARTEHCLMQILLAVGQAQDMEDPVAYANEIRSEFLKPS